METPPTTAAGGSQSRVQHPLYNAPNITTGENWEELATALRVTLSSPCSPILPHSSNSQAVNAARSPPWDKSHWCSRDAPPPDRSPQRAWPQDQEMLLNRGHSVLAPLEAHPHSQLPPQAAAAGPLASCPKGQPDSLHSMPPHTASGSNPFSSQAS